MEIVSIFAENLYSFHYENEKENEFERLMDLWTDAGYLQAYAKRNGEADVYGFIEAILQNAEDLQDFLENMRKKQPYGFYFQPLQESERNKDILPLQKGKIPKNRLRMYAIKLDENCYVITGGAIKMSQKMEDHTDTKKELVKLSKARSFLKKNGVIDSASFFELLKEN